MTTASPQLDATRTQAWPRWQRVGFRFLCLQWLLYAWTDPQGNPIMSLVSAIGFWLGKLEVGIEQLGWSEVDLSSWLGKVFEWLRSAQGSRLDVTGGVVGENQGWCLRFTTWLSEMSGSLSGGEPLFVVHHQATGSGDTMHDIVMLCAVVVVAMVLTLTWSLLDHSRAYPKLGRWLHLGARWYVALPLLSYGLGKFGDVSQFSEPSISGLTREVGDHSRMGLVWTFMGANPGYKFFSGIGELLGFALLLHRRTVLLGCFVTMGVMGNVCAINWLCGVPVKLYSTYLLLVTIVLLAPFAGRLWALFFSNRFSESVEIRVTRARWLGWPLLALGVMWASGLVWQGIESKSEIVKRPELYGLWQVEKMIVDGEEVPSRDGMRWESFAIDRSNRATAKVQMGQRHSWSLVEKIADKQLLLTPSVPPDSEALVWTFERSKVTRKVRHPAPTTNEERFGQIDREVDAIVFKGTWNDKPIELHTVQKVFRLHGGFRLIREFPR